jgi:hypothetical protein
MERAMKTVAVCGMQITLALIIAGAGATLVSGVDVMARVLDGLGHGTWPRLLIGTAEIVAGVCMLIPRSALFGVAVLMSLSLGVSGVIILDPATARNRFAAASSLTDERFDSSIAGGCRTASPATSCGLRRSPGWDI